MAPRRCPVHWLHGATRILLQRVAYLERRSGPPGVHLPFAFPSATHFMPVNSHVDLPRYPPGIFTDDRVLSKDAAVSSLPDVVEALQRCDNIVQDLLTHSLLHGCQGQRKMLWSMHFKYDLLAGDSYFLHGPALRFQFLFADWFFISFEGLSVSQYLKFLNLCDSTVFGIPI